MSASRGSTCTKCSIWANQPGACRGRRLSTEAPLLVPRLHIREVLEPCRRPVVAHSHLEVERVVRVVDSIKVRLKKMKYVGVLEQSIRHRIPVEVVGMLRQRIKGRLIQ